MTYDLTTGDDIDIDGPVTIVGNGATIRQTGNDRVLEPGMVFSVEPGVYQPGLHGARIEDIVVCTADGALRCNTRPHDLMVVD